MSTQHTKCDRCGYVANDTRKLIQHLLEEASCPPTYSTLSHSDIIERLNKILELTCSLCGREFASKAGKTNHMRSCKNKSSSNSNVPSTSATKKKSKNEKKQSINVASSSKRKHQEIYPFDKELTLEDCGFSMQELLTYIVYEGEVGEEINLGEGIGKFFTKLHSKKEHNNIKWRKEKDTDKYLVYVDNDGWVELDDDILCKHIGMLYSLMEEVWCDYEMSVRCGTNECVYDEETVARVNKFMYELIVDDSSVMFYCQDWIVKFLDGLK